MFMCKQLVITHKIVVCYINIDTTQNQSCINTFIVNKEVLYMTNYISKISS